jgi:hypothetical protein
LCQTDVALKIVLGLALIFAFLVAVDLVQGWALTGFLPVKAV